MTAAGLRFDHAVIAVRDLVAGSDAFCAAGFSVAPGGRHVGFGTENAIIRFGLDYIELISVRDEAEASARSLRGRVLVDLLRTTDAALVGYALAADDLTLIRAALIRTGRDVPEPSPMSRRLPTGELLSWELLIPEGVSWRRPWPFFIRWHTPDAQRLAVEPPNQNALGVTAVASVTITVRDLARMSVMYAAFGAPLRPAGPRRARSVIGAFEVTLVEDAANVPLGSDGTITTLTLRRTGETPRPVNVLPGLSIAVA